MYTRRHIQKSEIFQHLIKKRNLSPKTEETMLSTFIKYCNMNKMSLQELHDEADEEEEKGIRHKKRKIIDRIENFRQTLLDEGYSTNTIVESVGRVKTFYMTFRLEIPYIAPLTLPKRQMMYDDVPNKKHIKQALNSTNSLILKALILFMYSSCSAMAETLSITCQMFVDATNEYHSKEDINDVLKVLAKEKDVIPFFLLSRQKKSNTIEKGYKYFTCCTPEATEAILLYLKERSQREELTNESKLFKITISGVLSSFSRLNDKIGWGKVGDFRFFRSHAMRIAGNTAIEDEKIGDLFSGRKRNRIHEGYFKKNPKKIKEIYMQHIPQLSIWETNTITVKSKEFRQFEEKHREILEENKELKSIFEMNEERLSRIEILLERFQD